MEAQTEQALKQWNYYYSNLQASDKGKKTN